MKKSALVWLCAHGCLLASLAFSSSLRGGETSSECPAQRDGEHVSLDRSQPFVPPTGEALVNDHDIFHYLENDGREMVRSGKTCTNLQAQLDRKSCRLQLPRPTTRQINSAAAARAEPCVAVVGKFYKCGKCSQTHLATASGFIISESGAMVTCLHVIKAERTLGLVALTRNGRLWPVREVLAVDALNDLVIVQLVGSGFAALPVSTNAPVGSPVTILSHPENHYFMLTAGLVSRYFSSTKKQATIPMMAVTADFAKGSSGAPVLNEYGSVVGVVNNTQSIYYDSDHGQPENFQMTVRNCTPAQMLLKMIKPL